MNSLLKISPVAFLFILISCVSSSVDEDRSTDFMKGGYPYITQNDGVYYYLMQAPPANSISIYAAGSIDSIPMAEGQPVEFDGLAGMRNIWSPEMHRIDGKWYIYFEADDGNTDNHQLYVVENVNDDPLSGSWSLHGPILTDSDWNYGIHPSSIVVNGRQYLFWSGWEHRRAETETQCIFIAEMENPWTLKSGRILLSRPEHEWERQWINPDGSRTAYPIFVNENPEPFISPDGKNVIVAYSASGIWTPYHCLGILYASSGSDLLDPGSWVKIDEPQFASGRDSNGELHNVSNISVITVDDGHKTQMLYETREWVKEVDVSTVHLKTIGWDERSLPVFGRSF